MQGKFTSSALALEIQAWLQGGGKKKRSLSMLSRRTDVSFSTVRSASLGEVTVSPRSAMRLLTEILDLSQLAEFCKKHYPEWDEYYGYLAKEQAETIRLHDLDEEKCRILVELTLRERIKEKDLFGKNPELTQDVLKFLFKERVIFRDGDEIYIGSDYLNYNSSTSISLIRYAAQKLALNEKGDENLQGRSAILIANCDEATAKRMMELIGKLRFDLMEIVKYRQPGPIKLVITGFATTL